MEQRGPIGHRLNDRHDRRQLLIFHFYKLGRFLGHMRVGGRHGGHRMAFEQDFAAGQYVVTGELQSLITGAQFLFA